MFPQPQRLHFSFKSRVGLLDRHLICMIQISIKGIGG